MVATYFDKGKGRTGPVEYVLDVQRVQSGEATLLRGNAQITKDLIKTNNNELKYRSGVLSFTENDIPEAQKQAIMDEFERTTFAGMEKDQYNILWVQHKDKDRLELHFVIPRLELNTGKAFNPHWHKADQDRLLLFQDIQNSKYKLSNPYEAERANTLQVPSKWDNRAKVKEQINDIIVQGVAKGQLENREQIVEFLESSGLELKRNNKGQLPKNYLAVKEAGTDEKFARLEGAYYGENFTNTAEVERQLTAREQKHTFTTQEQLREAEHRLERAIHTRAEYNNERYKSREQEQDINQTINITHEPKLSNRNIADFDIQTNKQPELANTNSNESRAERSEISQNNERTSTMRTEFNQHIYQDRGVELEDRIRIDARNAITEKHEQRIRAYEQTTKARGELYSTAKTVSIELRTVAKEQRTSLRAEPRRDFTELREQAERAMQERADERGIRERYRKAFESLREQFQAISEQFERLAHKVELIVEQRKDKLHQAKEVQIRARVAEHMTANSLKPSKENIDDLLLDIRIRQSKKQEEFEPAMRAVVKEIVVHNQKVERQQKQEREQDHGYSMSM